MTRDMKADQYYQSKMCWWEVKGQGKEAETDYLSGNLAEKKTDSISEGKFLKDFNYGDIVTQHK